jgi:ABC-type transport system substrate-binding protein
MVDHRDFLVSWVETWWGPGAPNVLNSAFPHSCDAWEFTQQEFDQLLEWKQSKDEAVREALSLLSAAGFTRDNPLKFEIRNNTTPNQGRITAQVLQGQYNKFSQGVVQSELNLTDNTTLSQVLARGEFTVAAPTARGSYFDPEQVLRNIYHSSGGRNFGKWSDPRADELIDRQRGIFDTAQRKAVVKEVLRYFVDNAPYVTACTRDQMSAFQKKVKGLPPVFFTGVYAFQFEETWLDV